MFSQRSITEYPTEAMDWVTGLDGGESMRDCYQCGKCVPVCPVNHVGDYGPRKLNVKVLRGNDLIDDPDLWLCTTCGNCYRVCPKEVNPLRIMPAIREQAVLEGKVPDELVGRLPEPPAVGQPASASRRASGPTGSPRPGVAGAAHQPSSAGRSTSSGTSPTTPRTTPAARTPPGRWPGS